MSYAPDPREWSIATFWAFVTLAVILLITFALTLQGCENPSCTKDFVPPAWCDNLVDDAPPPKFPWETPPIDEDVPTDPLDSGPDATCTSVTGPHPCPPKSGDDSDDGAQGDGSNDDGYGDGSGSVGDDDTNPPVPPVEFECGEWIHICFKDYDRCVNPQSALSAPDHKHVSLPPCTLGPWHGQENE